MLDRLVEVFAVFGVLMAVLVAVSFTVADQRKRESLIRGQGIFYGAIAGVVGVFYVLFGGAVL